MTIKCGHKSSQVLDSRLKHTPYLGWHKHRRRQCDDCGAKFSTKEVAFFTRRVKLKKNQRCALTSTVSQKRFLLGG